LNFFYIFAHFELSSNSPRGVFHPSHLRRPNMGILGKQQVHIIPGKGGSGAIHSAICTVFGFSSFRHPYIILNAWTCWVRVLRSLRLNFFSIVVHFGTSSGHSPEVFHPPQLHRPNLGLWRKNPPQKPDRVPFTVTSHTSVVCWMTFFFHNRKLQVALPTSINFFHLRSCETTSFFSGKFIFFGMGSIFLENDPILQYQLQYVLHYIAL